MKHLFLPFVLLLAGCAETSVREHGLVVLRTQANADHLVFRSPAGSYLEVTRLDHSTPTRAGGSVIGTAGASAAGLAGMLMLKP